MSRNLSHDGVGRAGCPEMCAKDNSNTIAALIAAAAQQYAPSASSPLNPSYYCDKEPRRHNRRSTRLRPVRRKTTETPTERLLRRKAAIAHERTKAGSSPPKETTTLICTKVCDSSADGSSLAVTTVETPPETPPKAGTMFRVAKVGDARHGWLSDVERQAASDFSMLQQDASARHRLQIVLILTLLSICSTFLTIVGLDSLRGHYLARQI